MKEHKFRVWDKIKKEYITSPIEFELRRLELPDPITYENIIGYTNIDEYFIIEKFTELKDMYGKEIYDGDILNIFYLYGENKHIMDCLYVCRSTGFEVTLIFVGLLWCSYGYNQYPCYTTLKINSEFFVSNSTIYINEKYGNNIHLKNTWIENHNSNFVEKVGNVHENPELIEKNINQKE